MKAIRKTRVWFNPLKQQSGYIVKLVAENKGVVDLVDSYCNKTGQDSPAVDVIVQSVLAELIRLLAAGYQVNIPQLGTLRFKLKSKQYYYSDARMCGRASIQGLELKLRESRPFADKRKKILQDIELD